MNARDPRFGLRALPPAAVLLGPVALAIAHGGYFAQARWWAGVGAWALVALAALVAPFPLPRAGPGRLALGGLILLTAWTAVGLVWAPLSIPATAEVQRDVVYVGALVAAAAWLRGRATGWVEPVTCAGALVVVAYGLSERWFPALIELRRSAGAAGRLEQPYTYWNAMGALAALGWVLAVRLSGDARRSPWLAGAGAAATAPLALGAWLTFSRGALAAALVGLVAVVALDPVRRQLWTAGVALLAAVPVVLAAEVLPAVSDLAGSLPTREASGGIVFGVTLLVGGAVGLASPRLRRRTGADTRLAPGFRRLAVAAAAVCVGVLIVAVVSADRRGRSSVPAYGATAARFGSADSLRYEYWRVALNEWRDHPFRGDGPGAFQGAWLRQRRVNANVQQAHSLYVQTLAELGLVGLAMLAAFLAGLGATTRCALRRAPAAAAGPAAALGAFLVHAGLDWDWEMPALTLAALVLAGALVALSEEPTCINARRASALGRAPAPGRQGQGPDHARAWRS